VRMARHNTWVYHNTC